jgi:hypothetical protein
MPSNSTSKHESYQKGFILFFPVWLTSKQQEMTPHPTPEKSNPISQFV